MVLALFADKSRRMGPKRGGKQSRQTRHEPRRDRGKTWDEGAESVEASLSRLKVRNEEASSGAEEEEEEHR